MSLSSKGNLTTNNLEPSKTNLRQKPDPYEAKLEQILDYRKHLSILRVKDDSLFETEIDYNERVSNFSQPSYALDFQHAAFPARRQTPDVHQADEKRRCGIHS